MIFLAALIWLRGWLVVKKPIIYRCTYDYFLPCDQLASCKLVLREQHGKENVTLNCLLSAILSLDA